MKAFLSLDPFSRGVILCFVVAGLVLGARALSEHDAKRSLREHLGDASPVSFGAFENGGTVACLEVLAPPPRRVAVLTHGPMAWHVGGLYEVAFRECEGLLERIRQRDDDR